ERALIEYVFMDQPGGMEDRQVKALAVALRQPPASIREVLAGVKDALVRNTPEYERLHLQAVRGAVQEGDFASAMKGAQWVM
ncbi:hypothetical protein, partial [Streptococcus pneumoniae]|uniref:hypothetical protein n=1 Tax=Streptococcus pneumoniae TaxID=1313 RepID=UPI001E56751F